MSRAEFFALINRIKGFSEESTLVQRYSDVSQSKWYYADIAKALAAGYANGTTQTTMSPEATITREQAIAIITRLLSLEDGNASALGVFADRNDVASYFVGAISAMTEKGYVLGNNQKMLLPKKALTRAEGVTLLSRIFR